jgi:hypothetical protein
MRGSSATSDEMPIFGTVAEPLDTWMNAAGIIFRRLWRNGSSIGKSLTRESVRLIVRHRAALAGVEGHHNVRSLSKGAAKQGGPCALPVADMRRVMALRAMHPALAFRSIVSLRAEKANFTEKWFSFTLREVAHYYFARNTGVVPSAAADGGPPQRQAGIYMDVIEAAGRPDAKTMLLAEKIGRVGRRLLLVSLAVAVYEVAEADDKPREIAHQGVLAGAGIVGGWAAGTAVVAAGICAATAPVCVGVAVFAGGLLAAFGADAGFGAIYPLASR